MEELELELRRLIVARIAPDGLTEEEIDADAELFSGAFGMDSLDAMRLAAMVGQRYGVTLGADDERNRAALRSVRSLAAFIRDTRGPGPAR